MSETHTEGGNLPVDELTDGFFLFIDPSPAVGLIYCSRTPGQDDAVCFIEGDAFARDVIGFFKALPRECENGD